MIGAAVAFAIVVTIAYAVAFEEEPKWWHRHIVPCAWLIVLIATIVETMV